MKIRQYAIFTLFDKCGRVIITQKSRFCKRKFEKTQRFWKDVKKFWQNT